MTAETNLLEVRGLEVTFPIPGREVRACQNVDLAIAPGQIHAVVGESGSGKTMLARSTLRLLPPPALITAGSIHFEGRDLVEASELEMRKVRGARIGMIFQEPLVSLNPALRIGRQMAEAMRLHTDLPMEEIRAKAVEMLRAVRMPDPEGCLSRYPHEFSGGMRQRIMIASVMMMRPALLLADEPTTALDAVVQREVLDIMADIVKEFGTSIMLVSHDLGVVARYADEATVMEKGVVVEQGASGKLLAQPSHPYTQKLLSSLPKPPTSSRASTEVRQPLLSARDIEVHYETPSRWPFGKPRLHRAVAGMSLDIHADEMVGLVGESGSGKSTLGRALIRLKDPSAGSVTLDGQDILSLSGTALRDVRRQLQIIFQDPYSSLNPRMRIGALVGEGLRHIDDISPTKARERVLDMLDAVGLGRGYADRFPHEMSGGQRQRVAIARALVSRPRLVVADEPVSALDITIQAQILDLLRDLKNRFDFACLFISHDLGVVESICDRVLVMYKGRVMEEAGAAALFARPSHPYTCRLMNAAPMLEAGQDGYGLKDIERLPPADLGAFFDADIHADAYQLRAVGPGHKVAFQG
ncbi:ABC transporter ATP-binding protein [uncultured Nisaea sp.]|jgi:peptide/nickel transport system ATP-binding protein|uniref:ABC transporter ATP-binding protein n=1 Tax=uncultured Nisaea sp. TaxID=538215 RepID=UPI0030EB3EF1|tara:strand:- start:670 stop:2421 length:1752 start_codon:yes stop_codon:yes gene_type:complete